MVSKIRQYWENKDHHYHSEAYKFADGAPRYPLYELRLDRVGEILQNVTPGKALDAGCGKGILVRTLLENGWDAQGCDFSQVMVEAARTTLSDGGFKAERIEHYSVDDLSAYESVVYDLVTCFGVLDYVRPNQGAEAKTFAEFRRLVKPDGIVIVDNVNRLFDLFTFNKFTVAFYNEFFLAEIFGDTAEREEILEHINKLITNPDQPVAKEKYGTDRDRVSQIADNPMTFAAKVEKYGFKEVDRAYIRFHAVPPILFKDNPELEQRTIDIEKTLCRDWRGAFMSSLFLSVLRPE